jgi:hypothetical protein
MPPYPWNDLDDDEDYSDIDPQVRSPRWGAPGQEETEKAQKLRETRERVQLYRANMSEEETTRARESNNTSKRNSRTKKAAELAALPPSEAHILREEERRKNNAREKTRIDNMPKAQREAHDKRKQEAVKRFREKRKKEQALKEPKPPKQRKSRLTPEQYAAQPPEVQQAREKRAKKQQERRLEKKSAIALMSLSTAGLTNAEDEISDSDTKGLIDEIDALGDAKVNWEAMFYEFNGDPPRNLK